MEDKPIDYYEKKMKPFLHADDIKEREKIRMLAGDWFKDRFWAIPLKVLKEMYDEDRKTIAMLSIYKKTDEPKEESDYTKYQNQKGKEARARLEAREKNKSNEFFVAAGKIIPK